MLLIACALAAASAVVVPPDPAYLGYFDLRTLTLLFCMLATITALQRVRFFAAIATRVVRPFRTLRGLVLAIVLATAAASAVFTNDVALMGFLPLAFRILDSTGNRRHLAFVFVMMTVAANLGGMITPFGSPHNLFLHSFYEIPTLRFVEIMLVPFLVSIVLIIACCLLVPPSPIARPEVDIAFASRRIYLYLLLFVLVVAVVFRVLPVWAGLVVPLVLLVSDRGALARLDWGLLATFGAFFVFAGNLARVPVVTVLLEQWLHGGELLPAALASQAISNVPAAILLSPFTDDYAGLLIGVNIGGVGTLVASLASLIAFAHFRLVAPRETGRFLGLFSAVNFGFLAVLLLVCWGLPAVFS